MHFDAARGQSRGQGRIFAPRVSPIPREVPAARLSTGSRTVLWRRWDGLTGARLTGEPCRLPPGPPPRTARTCRPVKTNHSALLVRGIEHGFSPRNSVCGRQTICSGPTVASIPCRPVKTNDSAVSVDGIQLTESESAAVRRQQQAGLESMDSTTTHTYWHCKNIQQLKVQMLCTM